VAELGRRVLDGDRLALARLLSLIEKGDPAAVEAAFSMPLMDDAHVIGVTGAPGVGKSTLVDAVAGGFREAGARVGVLAVDPSSPYSGGALLGDRLRMMRHVGDPDVFIRSLANRGHLGGLSAALPSALRVVTACGFKTVLIETVGVGQSEVEIAGHADTTVVVVAPGMGDAVQSSKAGVLEIADLLIVNKADRDGATEAVRDLRDMLRLKPAQPGQWRVPVTATTAHTGEGVDDVVRLLGEHRRHLRNTGLMRHAREARSSAAVRAHASIRLHQRLDDLLKGTEGVALLEQVAAGKRSPSDAADALLGLWEAERTPQPLSEETT
jgi:LAO/AO transport system kinase